ncbi:hypothetical protein OH76DRAFT_1490647 [Lentinus brumalis]|uniref:Uncharacterized protein n=1 Tax=Lentinus brumalis TaxID=2498619 RepID=A0A371CI96_9APHY|nr:hypothetical protein OH76DRAFT_1490647 [Polyporus brumalis]
MDLTPSQEPEIELRVQHDIATVVQEGLEYTDEWRRWEKRTGQPTRTKGDQKEPLDLTGCKSTEPSGAPNNPYPPTQAGVLSDPPNQMGLLHDLDMVLPSISPHVSDLDILNISLARIRAASLSLEQGPPPASTAPAPGSVKRPRMESSGAPV